jgi:hypothetical protein
MRTSTRVGCCSPRRWNSPSWIGAQQLGLRRRRHGPHLVEEQRAAMRELEPAFAVRAGAR